jgi:hypothetical protein
VDDGQQKPEGPGQTHTGATGAAWPPVPNSGEPPFRLSSGCSVVIWDGRYLTVRTLNLFLGAVYITAVYYLFSILVMPLLGAHTTAVGPPGLHLTVVHVPGPVPVFCIALILQSLAGWVPCPPHIIDPWGHTVTRRYGSNDVALGFADIAAIRVRRHMLLQQILLETKTGEKAMAIAWRKRGAIAIAETVARFTGLAVTTD